MCGVAKKSKQWLIGQLNLSTGYKFCGWQFEAPGYTHTVGGQHGLSYIKFHFRRSGGDWNLYITFLHSGIDDDNDASKAELDHTGDVDAKPEIEQYRERYEAGDSYLQQMTLYNQNYIPYKTKDLYKQGVLYYAHLCTKQLIISMLSKLWEKQSYQLFGTQIRIKITFKCRM